MLRQLSISSSQTSKFKTFRYRFSFIKHSWLKIFQHTASREEYALPDAQAGYLHNSELRLLPDSNDEHNDSADERQPAKQRRNINVLVFIRGGVDRPDIEDLILMCIVESAVSERKTAQHNEENAAPNKRSHSDSASA